MSFGTPVPAPARIPAGANPEGDGIVVGDGAVTVDAYIDFQCPFCQQFELASGPALDQMVRDGLINVVYHPLGFLDGLSTTRYSSRAASASGCASDGGRYREYAHALFERQPPEGGPGLSDRQLVEIGLATGLDDRFAVCVEQRPYLDWVGYVTARGMERGVSGTPTVLVEGVPVPANARTIAAAVTAVVRP
jgi:protein-disulfide isomerase